MKNIAVFALMTLPVFASAETITFEADSEILIVRGFEPRFGLDVQFDIIGSRDGTILCLAMDDTGTPLATTVGLAEHGSIFFDQVELDKIDRVVCRYN